MKYLLASFGLVALFTAATLPAQACERCSNTSVHTDAAATPPQCALPDTKTQHPGWYRDGGYCEGATTTQEVTASGHSCVMVEN